MSVRVQEADAAIGKSNYLATALVSFVMLAAFGVFCLVTSVSPIDTRIAGSPDASTMQRQFEAIRPQLELANDLVGRSMRHFRYDTDKIDLRAIDGDRSRPPLRDSERILEAMRSAGVESIFDGEDRAVVYVVNTSGSFMGGSTTGFAYSKGKPADRSSGAGTSHGSRRDYVSLAGHWYSYYELVY